MAASSTNTASSTNSTNTGLGGATRVFFDPILTNRSGIEEYLLGLGNGSAHPYFCAADGRQLLLVNINGVIVEHDITDVDPGVFLNDASIADLEGMVGKLMDRHPQLSDIRGFTFQFLSPGSTVSLPITDKLMVFVVSNKKTNQYFDLVSYSQGREGTSCVTYKNRTHNGIRHSGDNGNLLHFLSNLNSPGNVGVPQTITVVGYNKRALRLFKDQQPSVLLVDYEKEIIYIVPCPLDQASVGNATLAHLVVAVHVNGRLDCVVLPKPITVNNVNTGDCSSTIIQSVQEAGDMAIEVVAPSSAPASEAVGVPAGVPAGVAASAATSYIPSIDGPFVFIHNALDVKFDHGHTVQGLYFGRGISMFPDTDQTVLPILFGPMEGPAAALGRTSEVIPNHHPAFVVYCGPILETIARMCRATGNGIFIIVAESQQPTTDVENLLNNMDVSATCMAGPNSIVLVQHNENLYWYRGVRIPGLVSHVPCYGDDVTALFTPDKLDTWMKSTTALPWPRVMYAGDRSVYFDGQMMSIEEAIQHFSAMSIPNLSEHVEDIVDLLTQISCLLETAEIKEFVKRIDEYLLTMIDAEIMPYREEVKALYASGDQEALKTAVAQLKGANTRTKKMVRVISNALDNLDSVRGISKKTQSIARRRRADEINNNVTRVNSMTMTDKFELFEKYCSNMLILGLNNDLCGCLEWVGNNSFRANISTFATAIAMFSQDGRMPFLDPDTYASLLEITCDDGAHLLAGQANIAIPQGGNGSLSSIAFPLLDVAIELLNPGSVNWAEEANKEHYALYRIMLRNAIAQAHCSRDLNISPKSKELGFFLIHLVLCAMESVVSGMSTVPNPETDWDSTNCEAMRGLFGQLLSLMASTNATLCPAYKLVYTNAKLAVPNSQDWWIVVRMARMFPYTCWDTSTFDLNLQRLLVQAVYKQLVGPSADRMLRLAAKEKKVQKVISPRWYTYLRLVVDTIMWAANGNELTPANAKTLLEFAPPFTEISTGTRMLTHFVQGMIQLTKFLTSVANGENWSYAFTKTVEIAIYSYVKHSGNVPSEEKRNIRHKIRNSSTVEKYLAIYNSIPTGANGAWQTTNDPNHAQNLATIIGSSGPVEEVVMQDMTVFTPTSLAEELSVHPGSENAVAILEQINALTVENSGMEPEFTELMAMIDVDETKFQTMVEEMFANWRSRDDALAAALECL